MAREEVIESLAAVLAGLQVPMSMQMPLGAALKPLEAIYAEVGFGWHDRKDFEDWLRKELV
jgi:hypothetical protein